MPTARSSPPRSSVVSSAALAVALVAAAVGACGSKGDPQAAPAAPADAAGVDAITWASPAATEADAAVGAAALPPPGGERVVEVARPLRGTRAEDAPVFVARGDDPAELVARAFADLDVKIPRDAHVVVKVNLGGFDRMKPGKPDDGLVGRITDPRLARALVAELRRRGAKDLVLADGIGDAEKWEQLLELSGYGALAAELEVPIVDLMHRGEGDARPAAWRMRLPWAKHLGDELLLSDELVRPGRRLFLVDVPKLKAHRFAVMTLSIKNLMGAVMLADPAGATPPWKRRWRMHRELSPWLDAWKKRREDDRALYRKALAAFSERLADLYGVLTPDLVVIEGLPAMQGDGFAAVVPYGDRGIVIVSRNGCYADWVAARFFGLADSDALEAEIGARMPPAIAAVAARYYGGAEALEKIEIRGDAYLPAAGQHAWYKAMAPFELGTR